jgi:hypothetical protein
MRQSDRCEPRISMVETRSRPPRSRRSAASGKPGKAPSRAVATSILVGKMLTRSSPHKLCPYRGGLNDARRRIENQRQLIKRLENEAELRTEESQERETQIVTLSRKLLERKAT